MMRAVRAKRAWTVALLACWGALPARAGESRVIVEASVDQGMHWSRSVVTAPGEEVSIRVRVQYLGMGSPIGLGGITHIPTLGPWDPSRDEVRPAFSVLGSDAPANAYGRVSPFNSVGTLPPDSLLPTYVTQDGELRWAAERTSPPGAMPIGVNSAQLPRALNTAGFSESLDVVVFRFGFVAGDGGARTMVADVPLGLINNARTAWFTSDVGASPLFAAIESQDILSAEIRVVPAAGAWCVVVGAGALCLNRRRDRRGNPRGNGECLS